MLLNDLYQGKGSFPWIRLQSIKDWEKENPKRLAALDALAGVAEYETGKKLEAERHWTQVILSSQASNASKMTAHAGKACLFLEEGNTHWAGRALDELSGLSCGYDPDLWLAEALRVLMASLAQHPAATARGYEIYRIAVKTCDALEADKDEEIQDAARRLRAECALSYTSILMQLGDYGKAERQLTREAIVRFEMLDDKIRIADSYDLLSRICQHGCRYEEAIVIAEKVWRLYNEDGKDMDRELELCVELWLLYGRCGHEPETCIYSLLDKQGVAGIEDYIDAIYKRGNARMGEGVRI